MRKVNFTSAFLRRLLFWALVSVLFSTGVLVACEVVARLSFAIGWSSLGLFALSYTAVCLITLIAHCMQYENAGGNSLSRFKMSDVLQRTVLALALTVIMTRTSSVLSLLTGFYVIHDALFSAKQPLSEVQIIAISLVKILRDLSHQSILSGVRMLARVVAGLLAVKLLSELAFSFLQLLPYNPKLNVLLSVGRILREVVSLDQVWQASVASFKATVCLQFIASFLSYSLACPMDTSKSLHSGSTETFVEALLVEDNPTSSPARKDVRDWLKAFDAYYELGARQLAYSKNDLPVLSSLSGTSLREFFRLLLATHAQMDLNRVVRHQRDHRVAFYQSPTLWNDFFQLQLQLFATITVHIHVVMNFLKDSTLAAGTIDSLSTDVSIDQKTNGQATQQLKLLTLDDIYAPAPSSSNTVNQGQAKRSLEARSAPSSPVADIISGAHLVLCAALKLPMRGDLSPAATTLHGPSASTQALLRHLFPPLLAQRLVLAIETTVMLLEYALSEDNAGVTINTIPTALYALLRLDMALGQYIQILHQSYSAKILQGSQVQTIRYKVRSAHYLPAEVVAIQYAVREGVLRIFRNYHDLLRESTFPDDLRQSFRSYRSQAIAM